MCAVIYSFLRLHYFHDIYIRSSNITYIILEVGCPLELGWLEYSHFHFD